MTTLQQNNEPNYTEYDCNTLLDYISNVPTLSNLLGGDPSQWRLSEIGTGAINYVYLITGVKRCIIVKQVRVGNFNQIIVGRQLLT
jgi:5-methylthioribose kinase